MSALTNILQLSISAVVGIFLAIICLQIRPARSFSIEGGAPCAPFASDTHTRISLSSSRRSSFAAASKLVLFASSNGESSNDDEEVPGASSINVLGTKMECCCSDVSNTGIGTGFYRNGYCSTGSQDIGRHTVCVKVTSKFLEFSKKVGNDLSAPVPEYMFPGLSDGDIWCLCAQRWYQAWAMAPELAPKLYLRATHEKTLDYVPFDVLRLYALDGEEADEERKGLDEQRAKLEKLLGKENEPKQEGQREEAEEE